MESLRAGRSRCAGDPGGIARGPRRKGIEQNGRNQGKIQEVSVLDEGSCQQRCVAGPGGLEQCPQIGGTEQNVQIQGKTLVVSAVAPVMGQGCSLSV